MSSFTIRGGTIVDGTGAPAFVGNVVVEADRIVAVGGGAQQGTVLDADGLVVAPGFIDIHSHTDWIAPLPNGCELLAPNVQQGITTSVAGNCGISPAPLGAEFRRDVIERMLLVGLVTHGMGWNWKSMGEFLTEAERRGLPFNLCLFVGHSTLRATVMGDAQRPPAPCEFAQMRALLEEALRDGAVGLSVGLEYFPGRYAGPSEVAELAHVAAAADALVAVHTRGISGLYDEAMNEALTVARSSRCRLQIAHVNPMGRANWDAIDGLFDRVDSARAGGLDVAFDIINYTAWTMTAFEALPHPVADLGADAVLALACDEAGRAHLRGLVERALPEWPPWVEGRVTRNVPIEMGWDALYLADAAPGFEADKGGSLGEIAHRRGADPFDVYVDLLRASGGGARIVNDGYGGELDDDRPLRRLVKRPDAIPETDTVPVLAEGQLTLPLPLFYGTMPRFLGYFCRELELVTLEEAVRRVTSFPAARVRLPDRGVLREGAFADLVVFDFSSIGDRGTFLEPEPAGGIEHVFVNGQPVVRAGCYDPALAPGRALRRAA